MESKKSGKMFMGLPVEVGAKIPEKFKRLRRTRELIITSASVEKGRLFGYHKMSRDPSDTTMVMYEVVKKEK